MKLQRNYLCKHKRSEIHKLSLENKLNGKPFQKVVKVECDCGHLVRNNFMKRHLGSQIHEIGMQLKNKNRPL
jgi:hypothetical protein